MNALEELYTQYKGLLFTLAYQMTGTASDAEDVVQDVFLKIYSMESTAYVEEPKAYLSKMVINRCRDLHKSARKRREAYFGEWLPEPVPTSADEPLDYVVRDELLSYATLVLLEKLTPAERAVFVLREALGFDYTSVAEIIGRSEINCRKLFSRAKGKMNIDELSSTNNKTTLREAWIRQFVTALEHDNMEQVVAMLAEDVVLVSDGGGKVNSAARPILFRNSVSKFLMGIARKLLNNETDIEVAIREINGQLQLVISANSQVDTIVLIHTKEDYIHQIYLIRNPDKLSLFQPS